MNYEVGDILNCAYGKDMIVRCYQVVKSTGRTIAIREIKCKEVSPPQRGRGIILRGTVRPMKGKFVGDRVIVRNVDEFGYVTLDAGMNVYAHKWGGDVLPYDVCPAIEYKKRRC